MSEEIVNLYRYQVAPIYDEIEGRIVIDKEEYRAILQGVTYLIYNKDSRQVGYTLKENLDIMRKDGYYFYSLREDYTDEEIINMFLPIIKEKRDDYAEILRVLDKIIWWSIYGRKED